MQADTFVQNENTPFETIIKTHDQGGLSFHVDPQQYNYPDQFGDDENINFS